MRREELLEMGLDEEIVGRIIEDGEKIIADYENKIRTIEKENEIEKLLRESGAKNIKATRALIDGDEDVKEQISALKKDENTRFLFEGKKKSFEPARSSERLPDSVKNDFEARLFEARSKGNTIEAIRIKQQAANEGIMLI